jgi:hypothetical protein
LNIDDAACDFNESGLRLLPVSRTKSSQVLREPTGSRGLSNAKDTIAWISSEENEDLGRDAL